jgi:hypothetical protein
MNLIFFPLLGLGFFVMHLGLGPWPALFSLGMMLTYSVAMGIVYCMIYTAPAVERNYLRNSHCISTFGFTRRAGCAFAPES